MKAQNKDINIHLGRRLRRRRKLLGMTQMDVASMIGVRFQQIQKYESASNKMTADRVHELSKALDVSPSYFYDGLQDQAVNTEPSCIGPETAKLVEAFTRLREAPRKKLLELVESMAQGDQREA